MPNKNNKITGIKHLLGIAVIALSMTPAVVLGDEIADVFDQLLSSPDDPALNLRYAELALAKGETRKALSAYERVLARDPNNREARRAYQKVKIALQPKVTAFTLTTGLTVESNPRQVSGSSTEQDSDVSFDASLLMYDERSLAGRRWRTLGRAGGHLLAENNDLNDAYVSIATGPVFEISKKTKLHIAPGAAIGVLDGDWLYHDGLVRIALERRNKGNGQSITTTVKYRDTNSGFKGDDGLIVQVDGRFLFTSRFKQGDALYFLPRFQYSEPGGSGPGRVFQSAVFPGNFIEYGGRVVYYTPVANKRVYLGAGFGIFQRDYDQNVAFSTKNRSDLTLVPTAHVLVPNIRGSKFDLRLDYQYQTNDSNDAFEDYDNHVISASTVRKF
jgi:hypothetical protein